MGREILRRMDYFDLSQVHAIEAKSFPNPWPRSAFLHGMLTGYECWVLASHGRILAYGILELPTHEDGHLLNICVAHRERRKGYARRLLAHLLSLATEQEKGVFLEVRASNHAARRLYSDMGFEQSGVRKGYYPTPSGREDALVFRRVERQRVGVSGDRAS